MAVKHCLPSCLPDIRPDIEATDGGVEPNDRFPCRAQQRVTGQQLRLAEPEEVDDMPPWNDEDVQRRDGESIPESNRMVVGDQDTIRRRMAKHARHGTAQFTARGLAIEPARR